MDMTRNAQWWVTGWDRTRPGSPEPEVRHVTDHEGRAWVLTETADTTYVENGAAITDRATGVVYAATIKRRGRNAYLSSLRIDAPPGVKIDARFLASIPADRLADAVAQYLDAAADSGPGDLVILPPEAVQGRGFVPDLEELARRFLEPGMTATALVAEYMAEYGKSRATVNRWIAKAREDGLIPEAETGRPPKKLPTKTKTPGGDRQPGTTKKKEQKR